MEINASSLIHYPRARVYQAYRDDLPKIAHYIGNVQAINVLSRKETPQGVSLHNEWVGKGEIPRVAQGLIKPDMLKWDDFAEWDNARQMVSWTLKIRVFSENFRCSGTNQMFEEGPNVTRVTLKGNLEISLKDIPGVPRILAGTIAPQVEKFIVALIKPNLEQVNGAIAQYLNAQV